MWTSLALASFVTTGVAKSLNYDFDVGWVTAAPDGFSRPVLSVNGKWPPPPMEFDVGDEVTVQITNSLGNETVGLHLHGQYSTGAPENDGTPGNSQCAIPPGSTITQQVIANPAGTHWYHSHNKAQYPDGLRAPMIVHDKEWEDSLGVADQYILTVSDWYHQQMPDVIHQYLKDGRPPQADSSLMNDKESSSSYDIKAGKKYLFRIINMSAFQAHAIEFESHTMSIVAVDGFQVQATDTSSITLAAGQRYDIVIEAKDSSSRNYRITSKMVDSVRSLTGTLKYIEDSKPLSSLQNLRLPSLTFDDIKLNPKDGSKLLEPVSQTVTLTSTYVNTKSGPRMTLGNNSYVTPKVPSLFTALTVGEDATNPKVYGQINPIIYSKDDIIQVIIRTHDGFEHPMHLHGHRFQIVARGSGDWNGDTSNLPQTPVMRDTATVASFGYLVIRFKADNPGVWPLHCHMDFHAEAGMRATFIEAPAELQKLNIQIPSDQLAACKAMNMSTKGNCAGNTADALDTDGCSTQTEDLTWGSLLNPPDDDDSSSSSSGSSKSSSSKKGHSSSHSSKKAKGHSKGHSRFVRRQPVPDLEPLTPNEAPFSEKQSPEKRFLSRHGRHTAHP